MDKILAITRKELYRTFTDRNLLIIMIAAPLAISTIVGLVFGGFGSDGGGSSFSHIPVAVVNQDTGAELQGNTVNYGNILVGVLIPDSQATGTPNQATCPQGTGAGSGYNTSLGDLLDAKQIDDVAAGRAGVENGDYAALIVIPAAFSARLIPDVNPAGGASAGGDPVAIEVYANSGQSIEGTIVRSIIEGFANRMLTGNIAIGASITTLIQQKPLAALQLATMTDDPQIGSLFACAFSGALETIRLVPQSVGQAETRSVAAQILVQIGSAQAVLFALFAGQFGVLSIISERRAGTLQRMLVTPTPRNVIIIGKLFGTFVMVVAQLLILLLALTLVGSLAEGGLTFLWGSNLLGLAAVIVAMALAVGGLGVLLTGLARTPEQVGPIGAIINIVMGVFGGAFGGAPIFPVAYVSLIYWGTDAFNKLANNNPDIGLNLLVLVVVGVIFFAVGLFLFNRRIEV